MRKDLCRIGDILVHQRIYFARPDRFSDPFDCALGVDLSGGATDDDWVEYFIHLDRLERTNVRAEERRERALDNVRREQHRKPAFLDRAEREIRQAVKKVGREQGVLCLSSDPGNVMMWAHYADNHEGVMLRFDSSYMADEASGEPRGFKVKYVRSFPRLRDYLEVVRRDKNNDWRAAIELFFCRKSRDWEYEKEWRFFARTPDSYVPLATQTLSGIVFGWKMPESVRNLIASWANTLTPPPHLLQAVPCRDRFRMDIVDFTPMKSEDGH